MTEIDRSMTFGQAVDPWLKSRQPFISSRTYRDYEYCKKPLLEFFGDMRLEEITPGNLREYQARRLGRCGAPSINHECCVMRQVLKRVRVWNEIIEDFQPLPMPELGPGKSLTEKEEEAFFTAACLKPSWRVAYLASLISINTSAGPAEILNLKLENVCTEKDPPSIQILNRTKNKYRIRHVPLNEKAKWAAEQLIIRAKELGSTEPEHYLIPFRDNLSRHYDPCRPARSWKSAHEDICATAGLRIRQYDLRHTAITRMLEGGVPEGTVMAVCGHVSRKMLQRYSHIQMKSKLKAVQTILGGEQDEAFGPPKKQERRTYLRVMINCSVSRKLVFTGMATEEKAFRKESSYSSVFTCPECKQPHQWKKEDAFLLP